MATRRERVVLELEDNFTGPMARAAAATALLDKELGALSRDSVRTNRSMSDIDRSVTSTGQSVEKSGKQIDKYSGRLRLLADVAAMVAPALVPISGAVVPVVAGLANQLGFAAIAGGSAILAFQGVGTALKAVNAYALEPTTANLQKMHDAMTKIGPGGREFVKQLEAMKPMLDMLRSSAQAGLFPGLTQALDSISTRAPQVADIITTVTTTMGDLIAKGGASLASPKWDHFFNSVENEAKPALEDMGHAIGHVVSALAGLWQAFIPLSNDFGAGLVRMSTDFDTWANHLSQTKGFADFVQYIEQSGPQVAAFLGAITDAFVSITRAAAPLGGPILHILTDFANVLAKIADSDLGTPIFTAVAALSAYNRLLKPAIAATVAFGDTKAFTAVAGSVKTLGADLATVGTGLRSSASEVQSLSAASGRLKSVMAGAFGVTAAVAGLDLLGQAMDSLYHRTLDVTKLQPSLEALTHGLVAGELQSTFGKNLQDLGPQVDELTNHVNVLNRAVAGIPLVGGILSSPSFLPGHNAGSGVKEAAKNIGDLDQALADMTQSGQGDQAAKLFDQFAAAAEKSGVSTDKLKSVLPQYALAAQNAAMANQALGISTSGVGAAAGLTAGQVETLVKSMHDQRQAALGAFDAETQWRTALVAAEKQAAKSNAGIKGNSAAALANRQAISGLAAAWNNQSDAVKNNKKRFDEARSSFIRTAVAMGVPIAKARELAKAMLDIPQKRVISVEAGTADALAAIRRIKREMQSIPKSVRTDYYVNQVGGFNKRSGGGRDGDPSTPYATGGYTGDFPAQRPVGVVHGREFVFDAISTQRAGVENLYAMQRSLRGYADGGLVGGPVSYMGAAPFSATLKAQDALSGLGDTAKSLKASLAANKSALDKATQSLAAERSARSSMVDSIKQAFTTDVFGAQFSPSDYTSADGSTTSLASQPPWLQKVLVKNQQQAFYASQMAQPGIDAMNATRFAKDMKRLRANGLTGQAYKDLAGSANLGFADYLTGQSQAQLRAYTASFAQRAQVVSSSATQVAGGAFNRSIAEQVAETKGLRADVKRLEAAVNASASAKAHQDQANRNGAAIGKAVNGLAASATQRAAVLAATNPRGRKP